MILKADLKLNCGKFLLPNCHVDVTFLFHSGLRLAHDEVQAHDIVI